MSAMKRLTSLEMCLRVMTWEVQTPSEDVTPRPDFIEVTYVGAVVIDEVQYVAVVVKGKGKLAGSISNTHPHLQSEIPQDMLKLAVELATAKEHQ